MQYCCRSFASKRIPLLDPAKDFKFFIMRTKVCQVYREALKEASLIRDPVISKEMQQMMKEEFEVFRRGRGQKVDAEKIDYYLALIRKKINMVKEMKSMTQ